MSVATFIGSFLVLCGLVVCVLLAVYLTIPTPSSGQRAAVVITSVTPDGIRSGRVALRTTKLLEALGRWSNRYAQSAEYTAVGTAAHLDQCLGYSAADGQWSISVNDTAVSDILDATVRTGDRVRIEYIPHS